MTIKIIRKFIHNGEYNKIPIYLLENNEEFIIPNIDYLNSIISGISKITLWNIDIITFNNFIELILSKTKSFKFNETTYTGLIALYSNSIINNLDEAIKYLKIMIDNNILVKQRTLYPLFNKSYELKNPIINDLYLLSKINNINIDSINFIQLIDFNKNKLIFINIIKDFCSNYNILELEHIKLLKTIFTHYDSKKTEIESFKYNITSKNKTQLLTQIEHFIKLSLKNKLSINKFNKFLNSINKENLIIIDGANIGYFNQGVNSGIKINWTQINSFINHLKELEEKNILLILNSKHFANLNSNEKKIIQNLNSSINIYKTVRGVDDDLFWLYSSIYIDNSRILTNDEITNHLFYLNNEILQDFKKYKFINYEINNNVPKLYFPSKFLQKLNYYDNKLIVPYNNNKNIDWITFNI